jgi:hypothetical protein
MADGKTREDSIAMLRPNNPCKQTVFCLPINERDFDFVEEWR